MKIHSKISARTLGSCLLGASLLSGCGEQGRLGPTLEIQGNYQSEPAGNLSILSGATCATTLMTVKGTDMDLTQIIYDKTDCTGAVVAEIRYEGSAWLGDVINQQTQARELNFTVERVNLTLKNDDWQGFLGPDIAGKCNLSEAGLNQPLDVTGRDCGLGSPFPAADQVFYSSFRFEGENVLLTKLPHEAPGHVANKDQTAPRLSEQAVRFIKK